MKTNSMFFIHCSMLFIIFLTTPQIVNAANSKVCEEKAASCEINSKEELIQEVRQLFTFLHSAVGPADAIEDKLETLLSAQLLAFPFGETYGDLKKALKDAYQNFPYTVKTVARYVELAEIYDNREAVREIAAEYDKLMKEWYATNKSYLAAVENIFSKKPFPYRDFDSPAIDQNARRIDHHLTYKGTENVIIAQDPKSQICYYLTFENDWGHLKFVGRSDSFMFSIHFSSTSEFERWIDPKEGNIDWQPLKESEKTTQAAFKAAQDYLNRQTQEVREVIGLIRNYQYTYNRKGEYMRDLQVLNNAQINILKHLTNSQINHIK